jgi:hypothetical protein
MARNRCYQRPIIQQQGSKSSRWIAADALRELQSEAVMQKLKPPSPSAQCLL